jgi:hypothetical protein
VNNIILIDPLTLTYNYLKDPPLLLPLHIITPIVVAWSFFEGAASVLVSRCMFAVLFCEGVRLLSHPSSAVATPWRLRPFYLLFSLC